MTRKGTLEKENGPPSLFEFLAVVLSEFYRPRYGPRPERWFSLHFPAMPHGVNADNAWKVSLWYRRSMKLKALYERRSWCVDLDFTCLDHVPTWTFRLYNLSKMLLLSTLPSHARTAACIQRTCLHVPSLVKRWGSACATCHSSGKQQRRVDVKGGACLMCCRLPRGFTSMNTLTNNLVAFSINSFLTVSWLTAACDPLNAEAHSRLLLKTCTLNGRQNGNDKDCATHS